MDRDGLISALRESFPELRDQVDDDDFDGLFYIQVGALTRPTQRAIDDGDRSEVRRYFEFARQAWVHGDDEVQNALGVSYIEHLNFNDGKVARRWAFDELPEALKAAARSLGSAP